MSTPSDSFSSADNQAHHQLEEIPLSPEEEKSAEAPAQASPEEELPPEARGEPNGGPLGCCLGVTVGLLLSISIPLIGIMYSTSLWDIFSGNLGIMLRIIMALVALAAALFCGYLGWQIGKRLYRVYPAKEPPPVKARRRKR